MSLLQVSLSGALLILAIVVIRAIAFNKLSKNVFLAFWGLAIARLLLPLSLPIAIPIPQLRGNEASIVPPVNVMPNLTVGTFTNPPTVIENDVVQALPNSAPTVSVWFLVWLIGAALFAGYFTASYLRCMREFRTSLPVHNDFVDEWLSEHPLRRRAEVRSLIGISTPLTYGMIRPVILMPKSTNWENKRQLQYMLFHEYVHIRRFDALGKLIAAAALCIHWFNPMAWVLYILFNRDLELACDETVLRRFTGSDRAEYARTLISMEEQRHGFAPLNNHFAKNAIQERIESIMKFKKGSVYALALAVSLVAAGTLTAFAAVTNDADGLSQEEKDIVLDKSAQVIEETMMTSYVDPRDGKIYYSFDGGKTFEPLTDEEYAARFPTLKVEWWTYDEYKEWLENEKVELQDMIGERAWTSGRGDFVWTQEIIDEAIAMYESILEDIGRGMLYSKTIDGEPDTSLMMSMNPADIWMDTHEAIATSADFTEYKPFGLVWDNSEKVLYFNGERVRYFLDGADIDGTGAMAIYLEYADAELKGDIDVHTVRERIQNPDGSVDLMDPITGLEKYSQEEFDGRVFIDPSLSQVTDVVFGTYTVSETDVIGETYIVQKTDEAEAEKGTSFAELFEKYAPFGITYDEPEGSSGMGNVYYNGQLVSRFADITTSGGAFTFTSAKQGGITVKTVYDGIGKLTGVEIA